MPGTADAYAVVPATADDGASSGVANVVGDDGRVTAGAQLRVVDEVLAEYHLERRIALEFEQRAISEREHFGRAASHALRCVVKPALQAVASRLVEDGVGGLVEERPPSGRFGPRLVLWMSLDGAIVTEPRPDRNPYLQLDLDAGLREVRVWEGDMWLNLGASRLAKPLTLEELTAAVATDRAIAVLERAAGHAKQVVTDLTPERDLL
jgi:hypothetical protein